MGSNTPKNRNDENTADQKLIDGLTKHAATIPAIVVGGASVATKDAITTLQSRIAPAKAATSTRATWRTAVQADRDEHAKTKTLVSGLKQALLVAFVGQVDALADFGLTGRKPRVVTPEAQVAAAEKAKATRAARHTMGTKQKAKIQGHGPPPTDVRRFAHDEPPEPRLRRPHAAGSSTPPAAPAPDAGQLRRRRRQLHAGAGTHGADAGSPDDATGTPGGADDADARGVTQRQKK